MNVRYELDHDEALKRARGMTAVSAGVALSPVALVMLLLTKMDFRFDGTTLALVGAITALVVLRSVALHSRRVSLLRALVITLDDDAIIVKARRETELILPREDVVRIQEMEGALGGLRVHLLPRGDAPTVLDIPRGGKHFGDLRAELETWRPLERSARRSRWMRAGYVVAVVAGIFFIPFLLDDILGLSRVSARFFASALVMTVWFAARAITRRR
jgi:hypothetical protein